MATPVLEDPNFARTVVLLIDHDDEGALGVVLNRPGDVDVAEVLPGWQDLAAHPEVVFGGGPVQPDAIVGLAAARTDPAGESWEPIVDHVRLVDLTGDPALAAAEVARVRIFAGYAGWGPGQLEAELAEDAWVVVAAEGADPFTDDPEQLWSAVLRRQSGELKLLSTFPEAPWAN